MQIDSDIQLARQHSMFEDFVAWSKSPEGAVDAAWEFGGNDADSDKLEDIIAFVTYLFKKQKPGITANGQGGVGNAVIPPQIVSQEASRTIFKESGSTKLPSINKQAVDTYFSKETHQLSPKEYKDKFESCLSAESNSQVSVQVITRKKAEDLAKQADIRASFAASSSVNTSETSGPTPTPEVPEQTHVGAVCGEERRSLEQELEHLMDQEYALDDTSTTEVEPKPSVANTSVRPKSKAKAKATATPKCKSAPRRGRGGKQTDEVA